MTEAVFYQDPYCRTLKTQICSVEGDRVQFEQTLFYPNGGGQPGDTGRLVTGAGEIIAIIDTRKGEVPGTIDHFMGGDFSDLKAGDVVELQLDWPRRHRLMRMHTGLHLLCSLVPRGVTGGSVGDARSRLDFDLGDHRVDKESLTDALNALVNAGAAVTSDWIDEAELDSNPGLVRTMSVQPPRGSGRIRMVRVEGIDFQPCGGTHVANTREIGGLRVAKIENKGKRNRRIHLVLEEKSR